MFSEDARGGGVGDEQEITEVRMAGEERLPANDRTVHFPYS